MTFLNIALNLLEVAPENIRKVSADEAAQAELVASIKAHGLLQNLTVRKLEDGCFGVVAGGRRLQALLQLVKAGHLDAEAAIPCKLQEEDLLEVSLAENITRVAMHPLDEYEAFGDLAAQGLSICDIAKRFGKSERAIQQRLKLGQVHPTIRAAYHKDAITLECLMGFTLTKNLEEQLQVFEEYDGRPQAWQVKRQLTEGSVQSDHKLACFVGIDAYREAGGSVTEDLFSTRDNLILNDRLLLERLAKDKLAVHAAQQEVESGWKWVMPLCDMDYELSGKCQSLVPENREPTVEEAQRMAEIEAALAELDDPEHENNDWTEEQQDHLDRLQTEYAMLEESLEEYSPEQMSKSGVIFYLDHAGNIQSMMGLVLPEDQLEEAKQTIQGPKPFSTALKHVLETDRLMITQAHLETDFDCAFDLMLLAMIEGLESGYGQNGWLCSSHASSVKDSYLKEIGLQPSAKPAVLTEALGWPQDGATDQMQAYAIVSGWDKATKQAVFAWCVARSLESNKLATIGRRLSVDMAVNWRPTRDRFWKRLSKAQILEIAEDVLGTDWAKNHYPEKKSVLVEAMGEIFAGKPYPGIGAEQTAVALNWLPDNMGFELETDADIDEGGPQDTPQSDFEQKAGAIRENILNDPATAAMEESGHLQIVAVGTTPASSQTEDEPALPSAFNIH